MRQTELEEIEVGDLVEAIVDHPDRNKMILSGDRGIVCYVGTNNIRRIGVEWESEIGGHSCEERCKRGHGWYVNPSDIAVVEKEAEIDDDSFLQVIGETR